jgi:hypothetical protein
MRDWHKTVEQRMTNLHLPAEVKQEVLAEVANHLEDRYERLLASGLAEEDAERGTLECIENWNVLERGISRERRGIMSTFGKQFTLPSALALAVAMISLAVKMRFGPRPAVWLSHTGAFVIYKVWPVALLLAGGMAAWLSMRAGASRGRRLLAAISPALYMLGVMLMVVATVVFMNLIGRLASQPIYPMALAVGLTNWVISPVGALLLGALPFLGKVSQPEPVTAG